MSCNGKISHMSSSDDPLYSARGVADSSSGGKFWTVSVHDNRVDTTWGKLGAKPTIKSFHLADNAAAVSDAIKRTNAKRKGGYVVEVESEPAAAAEGSSMDVVKKPAKRKRKKSHEPAAAEDEPVPAAGKKSKSSTDKPLEGMALCVSGQMSMVRKTFYQMCSQHGATIQKTVTGATDVLVTTSSEAENPTRKVLLALEKHKPVVSEQWVLDSVADGVLADTAKYLLISDPDAPGGMHKEIAAAHAAAELIVVKPNAKSAAAAKKVMLADKWTASLDPVGWWMSEKLDGVRAYWDGHNFYSRNGNQFPAPEWFKKDLPDCELDGELWAGRRQFRRCLGIVRNKASGKLWEYVTYLVFDAPGLDAPCEERQAYVESQLSCENKPEYAAAVAVQRCSGTKQLSEDLKRVRELGGEGLMLRRASSKYEHKRSSSLLKVKPHCDEEAKVVGHEAGKGKYSGMLGALTLVTPDSRQFSCGTGLTDHDRAHPPAIGSLVTYRYTELMENGYPRFPVFVSLRTDLDWEHICSEYSAAAPEGYKPGKLSRSHSILYTSKELARKLEARSGSMDDALDAAADGEDVVQSEGASYSARGVADSSSGGKFWTVSVHDNRVDTTWGKLGAKPTIKSFHLADNAAAVSDAIKRTNAKRKGGYVVEVESEPAAAEGSSMDVVKKPAKGKRKKSHEPAAAEDEPVPAAALLLAQDASGVGRVPHDGEKLIVGRVAAKCTMVVASAGVSGLHIELWKAGLKWFACDKSSNGSWINGHRLQKEVPTELNDGDTVSLGRAPGHSESHEYDFVVTHGAVSLQSQIQHLRERKAEVASSEHCEAAQRLKGQIGAMCALQAAAAADSGGDTEEELSDAEMMAAFSEGEDSDDLIDDPTAAGEWIPAGLLPCKFGDTCYRKNPEHFKEFSHPSSHASAPKPLVVTWGVAVRDGLWDRIQVHTCGSVFELRENQREELSKWLSGTWDKEWLYVVGGLPSYFLSRAGVKNSLSLKL